MENVCCNEQKVKLTAGSDTRFFLKLEKCKEPFDLTLCTSMTLTFFTQVVGTNLVLALTTGLTLVTPLPLGKVQVDLSAAQTLTLQQGASSFQLTATIDSKNYVIQFDSGIYVNPSLFS